VAGTSILRCGQPRRPTTSRFLNRLRVAVSLRDYEGDLAGNRSVLRPGMKMPDRFHNERISSYGVFAGRDGALNRIRLRMVSPENLDRLADVAWVAPYPADALAAFPAKSASGFPSEKATTAKSSVPLRMIRFMAERRQLSMELTHERNLWM
jgi:hypothetical protein